MKKPREPIGPVIFEISMFETLMLANVAFQLVIWWFLMVLCFWRRFRVRCVGAGGGDKVRNADVMLANVASSLMI